jgi:hypothetical protein
MDDRRIFFARCSDGECGHLCHCSTWSFFLLVFIDLDNTERRLRPFRPCSKIARERFFHALKSRRNHLLHLIGCRGHVAFPSVCALGSPILD